MEILKPNKITVYDNLYAKPAHIDDYSDSSIAVLFSADGTKHYGQFSYTDRVWTTVPGDEHKRVFSDQYVDYWFYCPDFEDLFNKTDSVDIESMNMSKSRKIDVKNKNRNHTIFK